MYAHTQREKGRGRHRVTIEYNSVSRSLVTIAITTTKNDTKLNKERLQTKLRAFVGSVNHKNTHTHTHTSHTILLHNKLKRNTHTRYRYILLLQAEEQVGVYTYVYMHDLPQEVETCLSPETTLHNLSARDITQGERGRKGGRKG